MVRTAQVHISIVGTFELIQSIFHRQPISSEEQFITQEEAVGPTLHHEFVKSGLKNYLFKKKKSVWRMLLPKMI